MKKVKLMDNSGEVFAEGNSIDEILSELNADPDGSNEWRYYYRDDAEVVNAYFIKDGENDISGENADETYDVIFE